MTQTNFTWPLTPRRLRAANRMIQSVRNRRGRFTLHPDRRGWGLKTPKSFPIPPEVQEMVCELGDEILHLLREEEPGDLEMLE